MFYSDKELIWNWKHHMHFLSLSLLICLAILWHFVISNGIWQWWHWHPLPYLYWRVEIWCEQGSLLTFWLLGCGCVQFQIESFLGRFFFYTEEIRQCLLSLELPQPLDISLCRNLGPEASWLVVLAHGVLVGVGSWDTCVAWFLSCAIYTKQDKYMYIFIFICIHI